MNWLDLRLWPEMTIRRTIKQTVIIVLVSLLLAIVWNSVSQNRIPLVRRQIPKIQPAENNGTVSPDGTGEVQTPYKIVDASESYEMLLTGEALFLDARLKEDFEEGHIEGALSLPIEQFDIVYPEIYHHFSESKALIVYCEGGGCELSEELCLILHDMEYENVYLYEAGWPEWQTMGLPQSATEESVD